MVNGMKKWEQRWWGRRAVGIEVAIGNEGRSWRGVAVEACGACFRMREQREGFGQLEGLRLARRPVVLWLRGKRVLTRVVRAADEYTMLASVLPEERRGDFVYCFYPEAGTGQVRVVLVQRVEVEALLAEVRALRGFVAGWVLGEREGEAALEAPYRLAYEAACSFFKGVDREELERLLPVTAAAAVYSYFHKEDSL